ncbi:MAG TPA: CvpA family protein [Bacilli bacterium]|nr:CvpA family protein [Bacilli bacterium]
MNIIDIVVIILLIFGFLIGFKRGLFPQLISLVGFFFIMIGAFLLKNPLSQLMYEKLPFFPLGGVLKGVTVVNILLYEIIAFTLIMLVLFIIFRVILKVANVFENVLKITIIFEIPSKIIGGILGMLENFLFIFIILYILSLPIFNIGMVKNSKLREPILNKTPILNKYADKTVKAGEELLTLKEKYEKSGNANSFNLDAIDVFLKYNITTVKSVEKLIESDKIHISGIDDVLIKYKNDKN